MSERRNQLGQAIGYPLPDWTPRPRPGGVRMNGTRCSLEPIDPERDTGDLFAAFSLDKAGQNWTYLPYGPFVDEAGLRGWIESTCLGDDPLFFSVIDHDSGKAVGVASYLRIAPAVGVIEVGHIHFSPLMQGRPISTEAMYLMMRHVFEVLEYRRYEWKCDALNAPSCAAARRLGFLFEGVFRQATIYKQRNRDTAWYSILDYEWPAAKAVFEEWLSAENFNPDGSQRSSFSTRMQEVLGALRGAQTES